MFSAETANLFPQIPYALVSLHPKHYDQFLVNAGITMLFQSLCWLDMSLVPGLGLSDG